MNTLPEPYYENMIGNAMRNFTKMVWSGELIEHGIKMKKLDFLKSLIGTKPIEEDRGIDAVFSNQQHGGHALYLTNSPYYPVINKAR